MPTYIEVSAAWWRNTGSRSRMVARTGANPRMVAEHRQPGVEEQRKNNLLYSGANYGILTLYRIEKLYENLQRA